MKTKIFYHLAIVTFLASCLLACKKTNSDNTTTPSNTDLQTQSDDQTRVSMETDAGFDDVNTVMNNEPLVTGSSETPPILHPGIAIEGGDTLKTLLCDAVVTVDTSSNPRTLTITYNGKNCSMSRTRTGAIVVSIAAGVHWQMANAVVTVSFQNLKITRLADGKSITLNGTHTYKNASGGSLISLIKNGQGSVTHTITSDNMSITFDDGALRTWNIARQRLYTYNSGLVITTSGLHTDGATSGISEWGANRWGNSFTTQIAQPLVIKQSCNYQMTAGEGKLINAAGTTDITFGLDTTGAATGCPIGNGFYYFKLTWTGTGGKSYTFILPY